MRLIFIFITVAAVFPACSTTKQSNGSEMFYMYKWNLTELSGQAVTAGNPENTPHLIFYAGQVGRISGHTGCNRLTGTFELSSKNKIKFAPVATTRMACSGEQNETVFLQALSSASSYRFDEEKLNLYNGKSILAVFTSGTGR